MIEPINGGRDLIRGGEAYTTYGMAGFFLNHVRDALRIIERVNNPNLRLHLDFYHLQLILLSQKVAVRSRWNQVGVRIHSGGRLRWIIGGL